MLAAQANQQPPSKTFIACSRCKIRKKKCDGASPKCSNCATHNAECNYAAVRKTRGPGKKFRGENIDLSTENVAESAGHSKCEEQGQLVIPQPLAAPTSNMDTSSFCFPPALPAVPSQVPMVPEIVPEFLLPDNFNRNLAAFITRLNDAAAAHEFYPLMPINICRHLINNSFDEIMEGHQFMSEESFSQLLEAQYTASTTCPAGDASRWALVNIVVALALRFKNASGPESTIGAVMQSFHVNATMVTQQVIFQDPSIISVQALLAMAVYSRSIPDVQDFSMLATNASYQLEILSRKRYGGLLVCDENEFWSAYHVATKLSEEVSPIL
ncbi:hypothetical protein NPX13_g4585 [Xylaria arbuscula]|uniref:Zn(2)-C6 fungal-type domain-containing protein n=1 Tax=Xylaria arbuscula TaxID=114810 RepID=A0A9W8NGI1_9PEZI|nr:hypothetical protein NPX13_g4585 [Xylaria arbuscula]